ncbi:hypothetical protein [Coleofasciculus sp. FACHB-1120]|uniref:hypothetical protein n=1 Tax=Coleofasciculus sp. FACHB-1120 TaxID=2692783 RepID=UPI0016827E90|nr:hypothetical protein [Coleofasciculus sp. FACHB-1120]MBD2742492.1 hypothetical protein [Coleofasciculus sp. FACHB-1120]
MNLKKPIISLFLFVLACAIGLSIQSLSLPQKDAQLPSKAPQSVQIISPNSQPLSQQNSKLIVAQINREFKINLNETAILPNENILVKFNQVTEDSRCPINVQCIWAGRAKIVVNIWKDSQNIGDFVLTTGSGSPALAVENFATNYNIKCVDLQPAPMSDSKTQKLAYSAALVISKITDKI